MNNANIEVTTITTAVAPSNSCRVDQETLLNSILTSFKKIIDFLNTFIPIFSRGGGTWTPSAGFGDQWFAS